MEITKLSGEELATILNGEYQKLMQAQANILTIQKELDNRSKVKQPKTETPIVEQPKEETK
jgi:hypothetical protein